MYIILVMFDCLFTSNFFVELLWKGIAIIFIFSAFVAFSFFQDVINSVYLLNVCSFFWQGHEGKFSVYVHASKEKPIHVSRYFLNRDIRSNEVNVLD